MQCNRLWCPVSEANIDPKNWGNLTLAAHAAVVFWPQMQIISSNTPVASRIKRRLLKTYLEDYVLLNTDGTESIASKLTHLW